MTTTNPDDIPAQEVRRLRDTETAARDLLRALRAEHAAAPTAGIAASIVTQHHIDRLTDLVAPL